MAPDLRGLLSLRFNMAVDTTVQTVEQLREMVECCRKADELFFDTETDGIHFGRYLVSYQISDGKRSWFVPVRHMKRIDEVKDQVRKHLSVRGRDKIVKEILDGWPGDDPVGFDEVATLASELSSKYKRSDFKFNPGNLKNVDEHEAIDALRSIFRSGKVIWIHNAIFDKQVVRHEDIPPATWDVQVKDSMVLAWLIDASEKKGLKYLVHKYLKVKMGNFAEFKKFKRGAMLVPISTMEKYAIEDVKYMPRLIALLLDELRKMGSYMVKVWDELMFPTVYSAEEMTERGFKIDRKYLNDLKAFLEEKIETIQDEISEVSGIPRSELKPNSTMWLSDTFIEEKKWWGPKGSRGKNGSYSTKASYKEEWAAGQIPGTTKEGMQVAKLLLEYAEANKLLSTYTDSLLKKIDSNDRLHAGFNPVGTVTGRWSSSNPNLQNIPTRTELGAKVREAFIAEEGFKLIRADYSQIELRILAHFSKDPTMLEVYRTGGDIHQQTADLVGCSRNGAKTVNFGVMYGMYYKSLAVQLGVDEHTAQKWLARYFQRFAGVRNLKSHVIESVKKLGYTQTLIGRRRYLPDINSDNWYKRSQAERQALNTKIQGSAADIINIAVRNIREDFQREGVFGTKVFALCQVHDELIFEVRNEIADRCAETIQNKMESVVTLEVPLLAEPAIGNNWAEIK